MRQKKLIGVLLEGSLAVHEQRMHLTVEICLGTLCRILHVTAHLPILPTSVSALPAGRERQRGRGAAAAAVLLCVRARGRPGALAARGARGRAAACLPVSSLLQPPNMPFVWPLKHRPLMLTSAPTPGCMSCFIYFPAKERAAVQQHAKPPHQQEELSVGWGCVQVQLFGAHRQHDRPGPVQAPGA